MQNNKTMLLKTEILSQINNSGFYLDHKWVIGRIIKFGRNKTFHCYSVFAKSPFLCSRAALFSTLRLTVSSSINQYYIHSDTMTRWYQTNGLSQRRVEGWVQGSDQTALFLSSIEKRLVIRYQISVSEELISSPAVSQ